MRFLVISDTHGKNERVYDVYNKLASAGGPAARSGGLSDGFSSGLSDCLFGSRPSPQPGSHLTPPVDMIVHCGDYYADAQEIRARLGIPVLAVKGNCDGCFDFETLTGLDLDLSKEDALNCWFAAMNHAMVLTGVNLDENGKPTRWKIENSWGDKNGAKGYYVCSDSWFDQYVFQAAVEEEFLGGMQSLLAQEPIELAPWDPMGTLAD